MCALRGEPITGVEFFNLLDADDGFCAELGRTVLAAGRLESALKRHLAANALGEDTAKATLGSLIDNCRRNSLLTRRIPALETLLKQRNYLVHNIHALLSDLIEQTILERADLLDSDIVTYTERAWELRNNLNDLAELVENRR